MKIRSIFKARGPFVMILIILALVYIGFQLVVDLGWMTREDLIRDIGGIIGTVALVIVLALVFSSAMIWWSARQRQNMSGRWREVDQAAGSHEEDERIEISADEAPVRKED